MSGKKVALTAVADVSDHSGGGEILIGGDYRGKNAQIQNAHRKYIGHDVHLNADAIEQGNGGNVIIWTNEDTVFDGTIYAGGGRLVGNGGFVETSAALLKTLGLGDTLILDAAGTIFVMVAILM